MSHRTFAPSTYSYAVNGEREREVAMTDRQDMLIDDKLASLIKALSPDPRDIADAVVTELVEKGVINISASDNHDDLTIEQTIDFIGEGRTRVYQRINAGQLVAYRRGRRTMITRASAKSTRAEMVQEGLRKMEVEQAARAVTKLRRASDH